MRGIFTVRLGLILALACAPVRLLHAGAEGDPKTETPNASRTIRLAAGGVDAITGDLQLRFPLGPRLPGRIPLGFSWNYDSQDGLQSPAGHGGADMGGSFRPVVWPSIGFGDSSLQSTVVVNGEPIAFYKHYSTAVMPSSSDLAAALQARHVVLKTTSYKSPYWTIDGPGTLKLQAIPTSDGTKFLIYAYYDTPATFTDPKTYVETTGTIAQGPAYILIDGPNAIWTEINDNPNQTTTAGTTVTHFTNLWGDHVTDTETEVQEASGYPALETIVLKDEINSQSLTLTFTKSSAPTTKTMTVTDPYGITYDIPWRLEMMGTVSVTNTLGLPTVSMPGYYRVSERTSDVNNPSGAGCGTNNPPAVELEGLRDIGFFPMTITQNASDNSTRITNFSWSTNVPGNDWPTSPGSWPTLVSAIIYPNQLRENFTYSQTTSLSQLAFDRCTGFWTGFVTTKLSGPGSGDLGDTLAASSAVDTITRWDLNSPGMADESYTILRRGPYLPVSDSNTDSTTVLHYGTATPDSNASFRAIRFTHPTAASMGTDATSPQAYLFASKAVVFEELITGKGTFTDPTQVTGTTVAVTAYDGFDLKCWANPTGSLSTGLPLNAAPRRTIVYTQNMPTHITVAGNPNTPGASDAYGPILTDEYTAAPRAFPAVSGDTVPKWSSALPSSEPGTDLLTHRQGVISRESDFKSTDPIPNLMRVLVKTDQKTLNGTALPTLRFLSPNTSSQAQAPISGVPAVKGVDFGTTTYGYDSLGRITSQEGDRTDPVTGSKYAAIETRDYMSGTPLVAHSIKTLTATGGSQTTFTGSGETITYTYTQDTHIQAGPSTSTSSIDGRTETFQYDPILGHETSHTDVLGETTTTGYDSWNRPNVVTRMGKGSVGAVVRTTTISPDGRHKDESVTADGKTLRTHTDFDAFGRAVAIQTYDANGAMASQQSVIYDGFGQKIAQTPVLTPTMTSWGYETWTYDDQGRVTGHYDRNPSAGGAGGRTLSTVTLQPTWQSTVVGNTGTVSLWNAAWTTSKDDRGILRSEGVDALGQKTGVVDQADQISKYYYDPDGHLLQTLQGSGTTAQQRSYTYNGMGWMTSRTEPEEGTTTYSAFTMAGTPTVTTQTGTSGTRTFTTSLDNHLMPSQVLASGPEGTVTRKFKYDYGTSNTHLLTDLYESQVITNLPTQVLSEAYGYDAIGRLISKSIYDGNNGAIVSPSGYTQGFTVSQTLNDGGQVTSLTYPSGGGQTAQTETVQYDAQNRPLNVKLNGALRGMMAYGAGSGSSLTNTLIYGNGTQTVSTTTMGDLVLSQHLVPAQSGAPNGVIENNTMTWTAGGLMLTRGSDTFDYDPLQRLSHSKVVGLYGEAVEQWYAYDRYGNRTQNNFIYTPATGSAQPSEVLAWATPASALGPKNRLPITITKLAPGAPGVASTGTYSTGALYDDLGRMTQVYTTPGQVSTLTTWVYDSSGRVMEENGTAYLLDASGLRFKRYKPASSTAAVDYTVYGFNREPLAQFEIPATATQTTTTQTTKTSPMIIGGGGGGGGDPTPPAGATITQPSGATTVGLGQSVSFAGTSTNGTTFTWAFGDGGTATGLTASHTFTTPGTYTVSFKASATGYKDTTATVTLTVIAMPSITSFTASPSSLSVGQSSTLAWTTGNATSLSINQGIGTVTGSSLSVKPGFTTTYTLTATNAAGSVTASVTVTVNASAPPTISSFTASPTTIAINTSSTLSWNVSSASTLSISGIGTVIGTSLAVSPTQTTSYTLTATNPAGTSTATITVSVETQLPVITDFWSNPVQISSGQTATLNWAVGGADSVKLGTTTVTGTTSQSVAPTATTTYTLTATNLVGSVTATVTVSVGTPGSLVWKKTIVYGFGKELAEDQPGMATTFIQSDYVGSPSVLTDANGTIIGRSKNLPFGERYGSWGQKAIRRYTNHEDDADSNAIYMQTRENLPAYGKFAQVDPAYDQTKEDPETWNLYNYVTNNPVTHTDPDGREIKGAFGDAFGQMEWANELAWDDWAMDASVEQHIENSDHDWSTTASGPNGTVTQFFHNGELVKTITVQNVSPSTQWGDGQTDFLAPGSSGTGSKGSGGTPEVSPTPYQKVTITAGTSKMAFLVAYGGTFTVTSMDGKSIVAHGGTQADANALSSAIQATFSGQYGNLAAKLFEKLNDSGVKLVFAVATTNGGGESSFARNDYPNDRHFIFINPNQSTKYLSVGHQMLPLTLDEKIIHETAHGIRSITDTRIVRSWEDELRKLEGRGPLEMRGNYTPVEY